MAAEALQKVSEAEKKGMQLIVKAGEDAKEIVQKAETEGERMRNQVVREAYLKKEEIIRAAGEKAALDCAELSRQADAEMENIHSPGGEKLERAADLIVERIVNISGYC